MSTHTNSTEYSSPGSTRLKLLSPSQSRRSISKSNAACRQSLSRSLSRTFSLRFFQNSKANSRPGDIIPKEISFKSSEKAPAKETKTHKAARMKTSKEIRVDLYPKDMQTKNMDCPPEIRLGNLWESPMNNNSRTKSLNASNDMAIKNMKQLPKLSLTSPSSKALYFGDILEDYERIIASVESAETDKKNKALTLERTPNSLRKSVSSRMLSHASPSRGIDRFASTSNVLSIHTTPARRTLRRQASVYIPKTDLDHLCNMYDDIVDSQSRSR